MLDKEVIDELTLYPSPQWEAYYSQRNIFSCTYIDSSGKDEFTLKCLCHYVQHFGDIRLRIVAEKLKRHLIQEENFQESDSKKKGFIRSHDEKLLLITGKVFSEIYRYTETIKQKIEKLYSCSLKLEEEATVFQRFIDAYFRGTGERA